MEYRGSKSIIGFNSSASYKSVIVKEQRVDGNYTSNIVLRCTLTDFERNTVLETGHNFDMQLCQNYFQIKIPSNQIYNNKLSRWFSSGPATTLQGASSIYDNQSYEVVIQCFKLNPWFITFSDAEACFTISVVQNNELKVGWAVKPKFQIHLHRKDIPLLEQIKSYFGEGNVNKVTSQSYEFRVDSIKGLKAIISHFDRYPLLSQKFVDYELFKLAFNVILKKEHLTDEGLRKIVAIKASINKGLSDKLIKAFPNIKSIKKPVLNASYPATEEGIIEIPDPQWLAGFTSGEGCVMVKVKKSNSHRLGFSVELVFQINQHVKDKLLVLNIAKYFNCGVIYKHSTNAVVWQVSKFSDLTEKIIPFFSEYPILGEKSLDFKDFCLVANIKKEKGHLTLEGIEKIQKIKAGMNTGIKF